MMVVKVLGYFQGTVNVLEAVCVSVFFYYYYDFFKTLSAPLKGLPPPAEKSAEASLLMVLDDDQPD